MGASEGVLSSILILFPSTIELASTWNEWCFFDKLRMPRLKVAQEMNLVPGGKLFPRRRKNVIGCPLRTIRPPLLSYLSVWWVRRLAVVFRSTPVMESMMERLSSSLPPVMMRCIKEAGPSVLSLTPVTTTCEPEDVMLLVR